MKKQVLGLLTILFCGSNQVIAQQTDRIKHPDIFLSKGIQKNIVFLGGANIGVPCFFTVTLDTVTTLTFMRATDLKEFNRVDLGKFRALRDAQISSGEHIIGIYQNQRARITPSRIRASSIVSLFDMRSGRKLDSIRVFKRSPSTYITKDDRYVVSYNPDSVLIYDVLAKQTLALLDFKGKQSQFFAKQVLFDALRRNLIVVSSGFFSKSAIVIDLQGKVINTIEGDFDTAFLAGNSLLFLLKNGNSIKEFDLDELSKGTDFKQALRKTIAFPFVILDRCQVSEDGKYFFFRKKVMAEKQVDEKVISNSKISDKFPKPIQDSLLFVFSLEADRVIDSIKMGPKAPFVYQESSQKVCYESLNKANIKRVASYNLITKAHLAAPAVLHQRITTYSYCDKINSIAFLLEQSANPIQIYNIKNGATTELTDPFGVDEQKSTKKLLFTKNGEFLLYFNYQKLFVYNGNFKDPPRGYSWNNLSMVDIYQTASDSLAYLTDATSVYSVNLRNGGLKSIYNFRTRDNQEDVFGILNDSVAFFKTIEENTRARKKVSFKNDEYGKYLTSIYFVSLPRGDTIMRFCDDTRYNYTGTKRAFFSDVYGIMPHGKDKYIVRSTMNFLVDLKAKTRDSIANVQRYPYGTGYSYLDAGNQIFDSKYFFALSGGIFCLKNRNTGETELQMAAYGDKRYPTDWLTISKEGFFEGNSLVLKFFFWKDPQTAAWYSFDAFYSTFYTGNLLRKKLYSELDPGLDIGFFIRIPGLANMISTGDAVRRSSNSGDFLYFKKSPTNNLLLMDVPGVVENEGDRGYPFKIKLPSDTLVRANKKPVVNAGIKDSLYYTKTEHKGNLYINIVCLNNYSSNSKLDSLPYSKVSVMNVLSFFRNNTEALKRNFNEIHIMDSLTDKRATWLNIKTVANDLIMKTKKDDCVLFYFIGHGAIPEDSEMFYFFPFEGVKGSAIEIETTGLSAATIADFSNFIPANRILVIVDACQSGGVNESLEKIIEKKDTAGNVISINLITSSSSYEYSAQAKEGSYLSKLLKNELEVAKKKRTVFTIRDWLRAIDKVKQGGDLTQRPLYFTYGSNFPFFDFRE